jgi:HlyD family secretion protein
MQTKRTESKTLNQYPSPMQKTILLTALASLAMLSSCKNTENEFDAAGAFESVETIVSTEASGTIKEFNVEEGQTLQKGEFVGYVDSIQLYLRDKQLEAQISSTTSQIPNISVQIASLQSQLDQATKRPGAHEQPL